MMDALLLLIQPLCPWCPPLCLSSVALFLLFFGHRSLEMDSVVWDIAEVFLLLGHLPVGLYCQETNIHPLKVHPIPLKCYFLALWSSLEPEVVLGTPYFKILIYPYPWKQPFMKVFTGQHAPFLHIWRWFALHFKSKLEFESKQTSCGARFL